MFTYIKVIALAMNDKQISSGSNISGDEKN